MTARRWFQAAALALVATALPAQERPRGPTAPPFDPALFHELRWRPIGPFRGGRTKAATGVPGRPGLFYVGAVNGGVWRSTDYGRTWQPIFDDQPTGSIGAIAVAPSDPDVIYVGSGEGMPRPDLSIGDGVYRSTDGGRSWRHLGLRDAQQIAQIVVHPHDPGRLMVAALGHPYGPHPQRGVFRSKDGGESFEKVLYLDENTGAADLALDPVDPDTVYAVLWEERQGPWENGEFTGPGSGLYKSRDGGTTWQRLERGLPTFAQGLGRIGVTVAPSDRNRLYATVQARDLSGVYRSDDAGLSWSRVNADPRVVARPDDMAEIRVHPQNPDVVFVPTIVTWKSTDGARTFSGFRGAPGGDDYQRIWIDPGRPEVMILTADQGAVVTVNGGETWSSWYNQPTAQFYHVSADEAFPYRVCGGQQESGSACVRSRGEDGAITSRDWHPVGVEEYGYVAPDPLDPDLVYGGKVSRYDRRTGQVQDVSPRPLRGPGYRALRTEPVLFSPTDPKILYFASNVLWRTSDGGREWQAISPDLTRKTWAVPASVGKYRDTPEAAPSQRGVIYAVAPSPLDGQLIWAGTDDGLVHLTRDGGKSWRDVTPPQLVPWAKVSVIEASHFDRETAWAAINTFRLDDTRPHVLRTRDGGRTWTETTAGIPADEGVVNAVREDPRRRDLLFAGSERQVWVSFDGGDRWQSLRLDMPATSVRDLAVKGDDLLAGTHGRGFFVLDDITPLRQLQPAVLAEPLYLFAPQTALRWRWSTNTDTPLPPDEPAAANPPDGVILHYHLSQAAAPVLLEVRDAAGRLVRRFSSEDAREPPVPGRNLPDYWIRPPQVLSAARGLHRFVWDLREATPAAASFSYPMAAVAHDTPREPRGPWVVPGAYTIRLEAGGQASEQALTVRMDPRVRTSTEDLEAQHALAMRLCEAMARAAGARAGTEKPAAVEEEEDEEAVPARAGRQGRLATLHRQLTRLLGLVEEADVLPTPAVRSAADETMAALDRELTSAAPSGGEKQR